MSENNGPVDPYRPTQDSTDETAWAAGPSQADGSQADASAADASQAGAAPEGVPGAEQADVPGRDEPFAVENEFSAPRPSGDDQAAGEAPVSGEASGYSQASPYGQPSPYGQASPYGAGDGSQSSAASAGVGDGQSGYGYGQGDSGQAGPGSSAAGPDGSPQNAGYQQNPGYEQGRGGQRDAHQQIPGQAPNADWSHTPPSHIKGVYPGPLTGQPAADSDARLWSMLAHLFAIAGFLISAGLLEFVGPLIVFLVHKDRNRFIRFNSAEALNASIAVAIAWLGILLVATILLPFTFGISAFLYVLMPVPGLLHLVFAAIGAFKANDRQWWNYPLNIRLVK